MTVIVPSAPDSELLTLLKLTPAKSAALARVFEPPPSLGGHDSLRGWVALYWQVHVAGMPEKTMAAKRQDFSRFLEFFAFKVGHDHIDGWTPAVTKGLQGALHETVSERTRAPLATTTVNGVLATLRTFAAWVHAQRPFLAGSPFEGVKDRTTDAPAWNGLTDWQLVRLKAAVESRKHDCTRRDQSPLLEAAVFYCLLGTAMREMEIVAQNLSDYHHQGFHNVKRKGSRVTHKVPISLEAREALDEYIVKCRGYEPGPLFIAPREKARLTTRGVAYICERLSTLACAQIKDASQHFKLTPHMLRHTLLKRIADKHGVHVAQQISGNVNIREVFRYTKPSDNEMREAVEVVSL